MDPEKKCVRVEGKRLLRKEQQLIEYLLCKRCERLFAKSEAVYSNLCLKDESELPIIAALKHRCLVRHERTLLDVGELDVLTLSILSHFALSVLWRTHESSDKLFFSLDLKDFSDVIRLFLLGGVGKLPPHIYIKIVLALPGTRPRTDHIVVAPTEVIEADCQRFDFGGLGIFFNVYLGEKTPADVRRSAFPNSALVLIERDYLYENRRQMLMNADDRRKRS